MAAKMLRRRRTQRDRPALGRKLDAGCTRAAKAERHRNLEPPSAEFICALAAGIGAQADFGDRRIERDLDHRSGGCGAAYSWHGSSRSRLNRFVRRSAGNDRAAGLDPFVEFVLEDAATVLPRQADLDFALIDCEKEDYAASSTCCGCARAALVVADNIISHDLKDYVAHVRARRERSRIITLAIGKGLEVTRLVRHKPSAFAALLY